MSETQVPTLLPKVEENPQRGLSRLPQDSDLLLAPLVDIAEAQRRLEELQKFVKSYLHEEEDYGTIPGTPKPTLYKAGADKLCDVYGLADTFTVTHRTEDWEKNLFDYEVECKLLSKRTGQLAATGFGSCNSFEDKYRWREQKRKCPKCGRETIIKGKESYGGGWICWNKPGKSDGCGEKFLDADPAIIGQAVGKTENPDLPTLKNTILKMAVKRAKIAAVLAATRSSGIFTQDMEDIVGHEDGTKEAAQEVAKAKIAALQATQSASKPLGATQPAAIAHSAPVSQQTANKEAQRADLTSIGDIVKGFLRHKGVQKKLTKGKQKFLSVDVVLESGEELTMQCFDNKEYPDGSTLFGLLSMVAELTQPVPVRFKVTKNGKYVNIKSPLLIFKTEFDEEGVPVVQRDAPLGEEPPPITDEDIPF